MRAPIVSSGPQVGLAALVEGILDGVRKGAVEQALAGFEEAAQIVDPTGRAHGKPDGAMGTFLSDLGDMDVQIGGMADDGRTACIEATVVRRGREAAPALLAFQRGDSGLVNELRLYWE